MGRVENFKSLGEYAMLPAVSIGKMIKDTLAQAAEAEKNNDMAEALDLMDWAMFLETEMEL